MGKRVRRYLAWALSLVLLLGSGLGGETGAPESADAKDKTPETTEGATEEPTQEPEYTEAASAEPTEVPAEVLHFSEGYVRLKKGSIVYEEAKEAEKLGTLKDEGIVYAELAKEAGDPAEDWLKITFDTQALRESNADFAVGYVRHKMVEALTDEEAAEQRRQNASDGQPQATSMCAAKRRPRASA